MMPFVFLVVPVGPIFAHTTNKNFLSVPNVVFFWVIVLAIKE